MDAYSSIVVPEIGLVVDDCVWAKRDVAITDRIFHVSHRQALHDRLEIASSRWFLHDARDEASNPR